MSVSRNHWVTYPDEGVALWEAALPPEADLRSLITFGARLVDAGKRHRVWDCAQYDAGSGPGRSYETHATTVASDRGLVPLAIRRQGELAPSGTVSLYRENGIRDVTTSDLGEVLRELRPERTPRVVQSAAPVVVRGGTFPINRDVEIVVSIRLDTDLWFPQVVGLFEEVPEDEDRPDFFPNEELATRHTPRLNAFLAEVQEATLATGGTWKVIDLGGYASNYFGYLEPGGIALGRRRSIAGKT